MRPEIRIWHALHDDVSGRVLALWVVYEDGMCESFHWDGRAEFPEPTITYGPTLTPTYWPAAAS